MAIKKDDRIKPAVTISRICYICGKMFALPHPSDSWRICDECGAELKEIILERKGKEIESC